jgi:type II secretory pathway component PulM
MSLVKRLGDWRSQLSPRERILLGLAVAIALVIVAIYAVRLPGEAAAHSAADRNARAAADLAEAHRLAASAKTTLAAEGQVERLAALAAEHNLDVLDWQAADGVVTLRMRSEGSADVLAWAARAAEQHTPLSRLSIMRDGAAELSIEAAFVDGAS